MTSPLVSKQLALTSALRLPVNQLSVVLLVEVISVYTQPNKIVQNFLCFQYNSKANIKSKRVLTKIRGLLASI